MNQTTQQSINQRLNGSMNLRINESVIQWIYGSMNQRINGSMNQWTNESQIDESTNQWIYRSMNPRIIDESMDQRINGSTNQRINKSTDRWINRSTNRWIYGSTNQWINGSTNQWIYYLAHVWRAVGAAMRCCRLGMEGLYVEPILIIYVDGIRMDLAEHMSRIVLVQNRRDEEHVGVADDPKLAPARDYDQSSGGQRLIKHPIHVAIRSEQTLISSTRSINQC